MAEDIRVEVDESVVRELFKDWQGPIGEAVQICTDIVEALATAQAPVSPIGSKFAPRGFLKESVRQSEEHHYDDRYGTVMGLIGVASYPYGFVSNYRSRKGWTINRGHGVRKADNMFLTRALDESPFIEIGVKP